VLFPLALSPVNQMTQPPCPLSRSRSIRVTLWSCHVMSVLTAKPLSGRIDSAIETLGAQTFDFVPR